MIDIELHEKLRAEYNPEGSDLRRQQMRMLEILLHIDKICKEHNIKYWLSSGTMLGAVRHGGFIPWDDDLDIEMMREDYLKFEKVFKETDDYILQTHKNDFCYMMPYAKVRDKHTILEERFGGNVYKYQGCFVDIFPMEYTHKFMNFLTYGLVWALRKYIVPRYKSQSRNLLLKFVKKCSFGMMSIVRVVDKLIPGKKLRYTYGTWCYREKRDDKDIFPLSTIQFEGYEFPAPCNADGYLSKLYGSYMAIPKVKDPHSSKVEFLK